jgi:DNA-binding response OmpR family regulator
MAKRLQINFHQEFRLSPLNAEKQGFSYQGQGGPPVSAMKKLPARSPSTENITLLAISLNQEDRQSLERILDQDRWTVQGARSLREATTLLRAHPSLILCEKDLPDGNWQDVFREARGLDDPPPVVVVSRHADEQLWAEVLNYGGYDVLPEPFEYSEVRRVMEMALRHGVHASNYAACA